MVLLKERAPLSRGPECFILQGQSSRTSFPLFSGSGLGARCPFQQPILLVRVSSLRRLAVCSPRFLLSPPLASVRLQEVGFLSAQRRFLVNQRAEKCLRYKTIFKDVFSAVTWHLSSLYLGIRTALIRARASRFRFHGVA